VDATVRMRHPGEVILSVSFDPGWTASIDGRPRATQMIAPALVATTVPAGTHRITFRYRGFHGYPLLFAVSGLAIVAVACSQTRQPRELIDPKRAVEAPSYRMLGPSCRSGLGITVEVAQRPGFPAARPPVHPAAAADTATSLSQASPSAVHRIRREYRSGGERRRCRNGARPGVVAGGGRCPAGRAFRHPRGSG
jgi:hypothetical protein